MIERYQGEEGQRLLIESLRAQPFIEGSEELARAFVQVGVLEEFAPSQSFITQGASDNDLFLIVSGQAAIMVNGREVNERRTGQHVGEMALIDASARRSASVVAAVETVTLRVSEPNFTKLADANPRVWRLLSIEIARRIRERNDHVVAPNDKPHVFIGSSGEALPVAKLVAAAFDGGEFVPRIWTNGVFEASATTIESLEKSAHIMDFAILVFSPDDKVLSRGKDGRAPRDNVIFELGLFMGALSRTRTFILAPKGADLKVPSDLLGVTQVTYAQDEALSLKDRLGSACAELVAIVREAGPK